MAKHKKKKPTRRPPTKGSAHYKKNAPQHKKKTPPTGKRQKSASPPQATAKGKAISRPAMWLWLLGICLITFMAFFPSLRNEFTNWDDNSYVQNNPLIKELSAENIKAMFTSEEHKYHMGNYHPLTMFSLAVDYQIDQTSLFEHTGARLRGEEINAQPPEFDPFIYHLRNILFHLLNTILVFWVVYTLFSRFAPRRRFVVALVTTLLFGLHPIHVESVTWISERKDVLYTFFFLLSLLSYIKYTNAKNIGFYALSLGLFVLSLLSKGQAVSLAVTLIAVDLLKRRKVLSAKVILEKAPFFVLAAIFGVIAIFAQQAGEAIHDISEYAFYHRIIFAAYGLTMYFAKLIAPFDLAAVYPYPHGTVPGYFWAFLVPALLIVGSFFWALKKKWYNIAFALAFFFINIFLLLQFIPVGSAIMADRYAYIPSIGFYLIVGLLFYKFFLKKATPSWVGIAILVAYTGYLGYYTFQQTKIWKDSITMWTHTLDISPKAVVAWNNRGSAQEKLANRDGVPTETMLEYKRLAVSDFSEAIRLKPDYTHAFYNRGTALKDIGIELRDSTTLKRALNDFDIALSLDNQFGEAYHNRGIVKDHLGDQHGAIEDFTRGIELKPDIPGLYSSRGVSKGKLGQLEEAIEDFNRSLQVKENNPEAYSNRGFAKVQLGRIEEGIKDYNIALKYKPNSSDALFNRALALMKVNRLEKALQDFNRVLQLKPDFGQAYYNRGFLHVRKSQKEKACQDFSQAARLGVARAAVLFRQYCELNKNPFGNLSQQQPQAQPKKP